jgi:hypothetical protein
METCDRGVIEARDALLNAKDPRTLTRVELIQEALRLRKYLGWMITLNDDWADTDYDEELSQVMISGGVYIAPPDTAKRLLLRTAQPRVGRGEQEGRMLCRGADSSGLEHVLPGNCGGPAGWPGVVAGEQRNMFHSEP